MSDSLNICLSCGFCCDGTAIGFVELENDEMSATRKLMNIEEEKGHGFFLQPCEKLACDGCSIYSQRPKQCASYNCSLLESIEQNQSNFDSAIEIIRIVKNEKAAIEKKLEALPFDLHSKSFHFKMLELKKLLLKSKSSLTQNHQELLSNINKLDLLLTKEFELNLV